MNDVTVCIKTILRDAQLYRCIETLRSVYPDIKIFVVDDGNVDKGDDMAKLGVVYRRYPFNSLGLPKGRNEMLEHVNTKYFVICDDDSVWSAEAGLDKLKKMMDISDLAAGTVKTLGVIGHYEGNWTTSADEGLIYNRLDMNNLSDYEGIKYAYCNLVDEFFIAKTEIFQKVKWDENYHVTYEHSDYFLNCKEKGIKVAYVPECVIGHKSSDLLHSDEYQVLRSDVGVIQNYKNYFLKKWGYKYSVLFDGTRENLDA
jgi:glycosyltransferase involved in cell wall biosynthesis